MPSAALIRCVIIGVLRIVETGRQVRRGSEQAAFELSP